VRFSQSADPMAEQESVTRGARPVPELYFGEGCPDCARREVLLPLPLPNIGDDFNWQLRDYDDFRLFMLEELAERWPQRTRWTPGDIEVLLVEVLAALLDQLSDMADRVAAEAFLETARSPDAVYRLLGMIGYDPSPPPDDPSNPDSPDERKERTLDVWRADPSVMDAAREAGPRSIRDQHRMVTHADYGTFMEQHPLVLRALARCDWSGSWPLVKLAVVLWDDMTLSEPIDLLGLEASDDPREEELRKLVHEFEDERDLNHAPDNVSLFRILRPYVDAYRMLGQEVWLVDPTPVGILMDLRITLRPNFYQSEMRREIERALGRGPMGFFAPARLSFGEDVFASDIYEQLLGVDGVDTVCLELFRRVDSRYPDETASGRIELTGFEIALCDNDPVKPSRGYYSLDLQGGLKG